MWGNSQVHGILLQLSQMRRGAWASKWRLKIRISLRRVRRRGHCAGTQVSWTKALGARLHRALARLKARRKGCFHLPCLEPRHRPLRGAWRLWRGGRRPRVAQRVCWQLWELSGQRVVPQLSTESASERLPRAARASQGRERKPSSPHRPKRSKETRGDGYGICVPAWLLVGLALAFACILQPFLFRFVRAGRRIHRFGRFRVDIGHGGSGFSSAGQGFLPLGGNFICSGQSPWRRRRYIGSFSLVRQRNGLSIDPWRSGPLGVAEVWLLLARRSPEAAVWAHARPRARELGVPMARSRRRLAVRHGSRRSGGRCDADAA